MFLVQTHFCLQYFPDYFSFASNCMRRARPLCVFFSVLMKAAFIYDKINIVCARDMISTPQTSFPIYLWCRLSLIKCIQISMRAIIKKKSTQELSIKHFFFNCKRSRPPRSKSGNILYGGTTRSRCWVALAPWVCPAWAKWSKRFVCWNAEQSSPNIIHAENPNRKR